MCSIIGVYSKQGKDISSQAFNLISSLRHRGPEAFGAKTPKDEIKSNSIKTIKVPKSNVVLAHCLLSTTGYAVQPITKKNVSVSHNGQIYNYKEISSTKNLKSDSESIAHFFSQELQKNSFESSLKKFMKKAVGEYSVGLLYGLKLYAFRDPIGLKPLWFGENESIIAFASEPSALMKIDIQFPQPLLPGHVLEITKNGFKTKPVFTINDFKKTIPKNHSVQKLFEEFKNTIALQTSGLKKAAVLFSGGIDSSLIAKAVAEKVPDTKLFVCGVKESHDLKQARQVAKELGLKLESIVLSQKDVESLAFRSMKALSFFDEMQVGIAVPELACADRIVKKGYKVVFSGQGSDEVFCGYSNYARILKEKNYTAVENEAWFSLSRMWSRNFYRDDVIMASKSLELRVPLVSMGFLREAMAIPANKKIHSSEDNIRKHPIRELAKHYRLPVSVLSKPKKAMQYGAGTQKIVSKLFK